MGRAIVLFLGLVLIGLVAGHFTGFWIDITPALFERAGPGGLTTDFGVGLVTEFTSFVFQVIVTIVIFQFVAGANSRRNKRRARQDIGDALADVYLNFLTIEPNVQWRSLSRTSVKRDGVLKAFYNLLIENSEGLDPTIKSHARNAQDEFDKLFFPEEASIRTREYAELRSIAFLKQLKKALKALGQTDSLLRKNEERVRKLAALRDAIKLRLAECDPKLVEEFESTVGSIELANERFA